MTTQKTFAQELDEQTQLLGRIHAAAKEKLAQADIAMKNEDFDEADRLIAESRKYMRAVSTANRKFEIEHPEVAKTVRKAHTWRWTVYLDTYATFFCGYLFAVLLVIAYQIYIDRGTAVGQILGYGFAAIILIPLLGINLKSRPECRDCSGRVLQPGEECPGA